ncbi:unnamed protein product [Darwinula stevensoni]|uniref:Uncharacterized protein n=1 Tax=Darwinula stevensoni TaxID=69355 RepID=A0A7R9ADE2_9CRUS|nr:unnamed protein product [Darwinula stevensoni]CAG0901237.1 unnamed protein product [Darwinula stevensoni]
MLQEFSFGIPVVLTPAGTAALGNDIALIHLPSRLTFGPSIQPICYPITDDLGTAIAGCDKKICGWGYSKQDIGSRYPESLCMRDPSRADLHIRQEYTLKGTSGGLQSTSVLASKHLPVSLTLKMQATSGFLSLFILLLGSILGTSGRTACPVSDLILPCVCYHHLGRQTIVDCSEAKSSDEIFSAFNDVSWPFTEIWKFQLTHNWEILELPDGVFGDVTFEEIYIYNDSLVSLHPGAILPSKDRLRELKLSRCGMGKIPGGMEEFPWDILPQFNKLTRLYLTINALTTLPAIQSASLEQIQIGDNQIMTLESGSSLPRLSFFSMGWNPISEIPPGFFSDMEGLRDYYCMGCSLGPTLATRTFDFHNGRIRIFQLEDNSISALEVDAITGLQPSTQIYLRENEIEVLAMDSFRPMLDVLSQGAGFIELYGWNPISEIPPGFFSDMEGLRDYYCMGCSLGPTLATRTFDFHNGRIRIFQLEDNSISTLEVDAITGLQPSTQIYLRENEIEVLAMDSFRPMLDVLSQGAGFIELYGNPVECNCTMAWIVQNPDYLASPQGKTQSTLEGASRRSNPLPPLSHFPDSLTLKMQECLIPLSLLFLLSSVRGTSGQDPCPEYDNLAPCYCSYKDGINTVTVDCSRATSSEGIFSYFNNVNWPFTNLTEFRMTPNEAVRELPKGVFGDVTFQKITLIRTSVRRIHPSVLLPSKDRIRTLEMTHGALEEFPWHILRQLTNLSTLWLFRNALTTLPPLKSSSLRTLHIFVNDITNLEAGWSLPNLTALCLDSNPISEVPAGFFSDMGNLGDFRCEYCGLGPTLSTGSLKFRSSAVQFIRLEYNSISTLEPDAITGFQSNTRIFMSYNEIRKLTEESFRPMLEVLSLGNGFIRLYRNPIECGCSMAWVVLNPDFLASIAGSCHTGMDFHDLDPNIFENFCVRRDPPMPGDYSTWINS